MVEKKKNVHLNATKIGTSLPILVSRKSLYLEMGWVPIIERHQRTKLTIKQKIHTVEIPKYLSEIMPNKRGSISKYTTHNSQ